MLTALREGFRSVSRSAGLVLLVFATNVALAAVLAVPLASTLERELANSESARGMLYGFDHAWWSQWNESQSGYAKGLAPDILGAGFAFKNVDALLRGELPAGLLRIRSGNEESSGGRGGGETRVDALVAALGLGYLLLQTFLLGGILGVFRSGQGSWTMRGLLHGSGFYFGRLVRVAMLALLADSLVFLLNAPFARWADGLAKESVSEQTAMTFTIGRHAVLLLALLLVNLLSSYAKVIVVVEERSSAILAFLSALGFCVSNARRAIGHYVSIAILGVLLVAVWNALDSRIETTGYKTQLVTFGLMQALVLGRIGLRLSLLAGMTAVYKQRAPIA